MKACSGPAQIELIHFEIDLREEHLNSVQELFQNAGSFSHCLEPLFR